MRDDGLLQSREIEGSAWLGVPGIVGRDTHQDSNRSGLKNHDRHEPWTHDGTAPWTRAKTAPFPRQAGPQYLFRRLGPTWPAGSLDCLSGSSDFESSSTQIVS